MDKQRRDEIREKLREAAARPKAPVIPPPRYDDVYREGVAALDAIGRGEPLLLPGDLGLTNSFRAPHLHTRLLARAIAALSRTWREPPTLATHAFIVTKGGTLREAEIIESQARTREGNLYDLYAGTGKEVSFWRLKGLTDAERQRIVLKALSYRNTTYGWWVLIAHWLDWFFLGAYLFRRLIRSDRHPRCHYLAAMAYEAIGYRTLRGIYHGELRHPFGKIPRALDGPDGLWDYVTTHPDEWECVRKLAPIERGT